MKRRVGALTLFVTGGLIGTVLIAGEETRMLVPEGVAASRPSTGQATKVPHGQYQPAGKTDGNSASSSREIGVTIWKLRRSAAGDDGARILVQEETRTEEWVPERVASTSQLRAGDRVRLSIEAPEAGYLYVIDREKYSSGKRGEPYLIFPTTRTHGGDNRVSAGKLIDIPAQDDQPNYFTMRKGRADQAEEELTVLLAPKPLEGVTIGRKPLVLSESETASWEAQWGAGKTEIFELAGGAGKTWTRVEQQAASEGTRILTQEDPPPQTVYRVAAEPGRPFLIRVRLRYRMD